MKTKVPQVQRSHAEGHAGSQSWVLKQNLAMHRLVNIVSQDNAALKEGYENTCGLYCLLVPAVCAAWIEEW